MNTIKIKFKNGDVKEYEKGVTYYEISKDVKMIHPIIGVKVNNEVFGLDQVARNNQVLQFIDYTDLIGYNIYKSGLKMVFELALSRLYKDCYVTFEHSVPRGMLSYVRGNVHITNDDISKIKGEMANIISEDIIFKRLNVSKKEAINYFDKVKQFEKANNIRNLSDSNIVLWKLDNLINYYYTEMPYSTSAIDKFELVYLGNNRVVFLWPSSRSNGLVPEYVHYDNILKSFYYGQQWLDTLKMPYLNDLNRVVSTGKIKDFINSSELVYNIYISKVAEKILNNKDIKFVMIAGPSSSGKTTSCKRLANYLEAVGYSTISISTDDYFINRDESPKDENGNYDFECLEAVNVKEMSDDLNKLLKNKTIYKREYNFITGRGERTKKILQLKDNSIILIEGLHCLNDALLPDIDPKLKYKIYLSPFIPLNIDRHNYISTTDLRLIRRIVRDNRSRGYGVATTIKNWQMVRNGEEKYIFPYIHQADVIINTALTYEIGVLKVYIEPLLHLVGVDSEFYEEAQRLLRFLNQFFPIPGEYVNKESILREFIGGGYYD